MKLSVIIPAFNEAKYIERCVGSIAKAMEVHAVRLTDMEIIVTDSRRTARLKRKRSVPPWA